MNKYLYYKGKKYILRAESNTWNQAICYGKFHKKQNKKRYYIKPLKTKFEIYIEK